MAQLSLLIGGVSLDANSIELKQRVGECSSVLVDVAQSPENDAKFPTALKGLGVSNPASVSLDWGAASSLFIGQRLEGVSSERRVLRLSWPNAFLDDPTLILVEQNQTLQSLMSAAGNDSLKRFLTQSVDNAVWNHDGAANTRMDFVQRSFVLPSGKSVREFLIHACTFADEKAMLVFKRAACHWCIMKPNQMNDAHFAALQPFSLERVESTGLAGTWYRRIRTITSETQEQEITSSIDSPLENHGELLTIARNDKFERQKGGHLSERQQPAKWTTELLMVQTEEYFSALARQQISMNWDEPVLARGTVTELKTEADSPALVTVELNRGAGVLTALLATASADVDHRQGFHAPPYPGADVLVAIPRGFSGTPGDLSTTGLIHPVVLCEIRNDAITIPRLASKKAAFLSFAGGVLNMHRGQYGGYISVTPKSTSIYSESENGHAGTDWSNGEIAYHDENRSDPVDNEPDISE